MIIRIDQFGIFFPDKQQIAERAYLIWDNLGKPELGKDFTTQVWLQAEYELQKEMALVAYFKQLKEA